MNLSNELTQLLGIEHPVIQAPMGGDSTPEMAVAVSNAGGLGGLGCSYMALQEIEAKVEKIRSLTNAPFNLNFFAHPEPSIDEVVNAKTRARLASFYAELGLAGNSGEGIAPCDTFTDERLKLVLELRPKIVSFHFGLPPAEKIRALKDVDIIIMCSATTVAEAIWLDKSGVDVIIAQGWEAGGHRGTFDVTYEDFGVGTMALVPQIVDAVNKPVIASGGIADGRGIAASLMLGAKGVQLGTAFLSCPEANITSENRSAIINARDDETRLTRAFSGRPARAKTNSYIESMAHDRSRLPDFPLMYNFSGPLEKACTDGLGDGFEFFLYGQAASLNRELLAADLVELLVKETIETLSKHLV
jgi:nitronate monooxygenase